MDQSKAIILGANGQLGKELKKQYPQARAYSSSELDITNRDSLASIDWSNIEVVLNAAAYTKVDEAETSEGRVKAWKINAIAAANLAMIADEHNIILVHISTDYVFDGIQDTHTEDETLSPLSVYGSSKAAGDIAVANSHRHYILRTSWVIGDGNNFVRTMVGLSRKDISPTVVNDQIGRLTFTNEIVRAIDHLLSSGAAYGIYNLSNSGESTSWANLTREIFSALGRNDLTVTDTSTKEYYKDKENIAPRPLKSTLDLTKINDTGFNSNNWKTELSNYIKEG